MKSEGSQHSDLPLYHGIGFKYKPTDIPGHSLEFGPDRINSIHGEYRVMETTVKNIELQPEIKRWFVIRMDMTAGKDNKLEH
ncbi:hypothetical protein Ciccas_012528 [Cichlidogyrus casuarinus]|uniref:Uncharacterized protein n=1 Tax=Cichlidogyrus casuarinus TaxID=1844966 RepID=A0ABD2PPY6_9PLAT